MPERLKKLRELNERRAAAATRAQALAMQNTPLDPEKQLRLLAEHRQAMEMWCHLESEFNKLFRELTQDELAELAKEEE